MKQHQQIINLILILILSHGLAAQEVGKPESQTKSKLDTTRLFSDKPVKSPWGAVLRSAVLPGWGQFYNESYLKAGAALAINGTLLGTIFYYNDRWQAKRDVQFRDRRDTFIWIWGVVYLLTMVDAYVDANLYGFDKVLRLSVQPPQKYNHPGMLSLQLRF